jgi:flagellar export protein FliJ
MSTRDAMTTVARLRELREEQARAELAAATTALQQARAAEEAAGSALRTDRGDARSLAQLRLDRTVDIGLREELEAATQRTRVAEHEHAAATARWRQRRADQRAVERLLERRDAAARAEAVVAEQAALDELAVLGHAGGRA